MIAAALVMPACGVRAAGMAQGEPGCDQGAFVAANSALRFGRVSGAGPARLLVDGEDCPSPAAACRGAGAVPARQRLLLGRSKGGYVCVLVLSARGSATGWLARRQIAGHTAPVDPAPPLAAWSGTWRQSDNRITLSLEDGRIKGEGEAYWPARNVMPANEGAFDGSAASTGNHLRFTSTEPDACDVRMTLAGAFLIVDDNRQCGGHDASFFGVFVR